jgi:phenylacetic acid degradation operon negative regulatory protein
MEAVSSAETAADKANGALRPEAAFLIRTLLIHEYRKVHLQDPLLPPALLPPEWVGAAAYELSKRLYSAVFHAAERYLSATASTMAEPLPAADASAYARFAGLA